MSEIIPLFNSKSNSPFINLIYSAEMKSVSAEELGEAIIGMQKCLKQAALIGGVEYDDIGVVAIEHGSVKTVFVYLKNNTWVYVDRLEKVGSLIAASIVIIGAFGIGSFKNPTPELLSAIKERGVLELCKNKNFQKGAQSIVKPLNEFNQKAILKITDKEIEINCEDKEKYYIEEEQEKILPELKNGSEVTLKGEITRINKRTNDLGFRYEGYNLTVLPLLKDQNTADFHDSLRAKEVLLSGIVIRNSEYETPKLKVIDIQNTQQLLVK